MSLPSSMADFVPCDRSLQKAYSGLKITMFYTNFTTVNPLEMNVVEKWPVFTYGVHIFIAIGIHSTHSK